MSECPKCLEQFENDDECLQSDHGLCWPCASAKLDDVLDDARAQRIRDIVAQQWAVACVAMRNTGTIGQATGGTVRDLAWDDGYDVAMEAFAGDLAALPSAAEIVGGGE